MRILWVKAGKILPVNTGGRIRSFNILKHLATRNETTFLSYYPGPRDREYDEELAALFPRAITEPFPAPRGIVGRVADYLRKLPREAPYAVSGFAHASVRRAVERAVAERKPDVVVCDFLAASLNVSNFPGTKGVLFQHNVEQALWERQAQNESNMLKRIAFSLEAAKMRRFENTTIRRFDHVIAVSEHDRSLMSAVIPADHITVVRTGVDVAAYREAAVESDAHNVMFLGSMDWRPNIDGVAWFCEQIWPRVVQQVPDAMFHIVGRNPPARIRELASSSVRVAGGVDSVIPSLRESPVFVVPLRAGGGTRLKIYEAMAAERAIVSTTVGAEGLDYVDGSDLLIADEPQAFANAVVALLTDGERRRSIAKAAGETAARFDWSEIARDFERVLLDVAGSTRPPSAPARH